MTRREIPTPETPIKLSGKIEEADYVSAMWLHLRPRPVLAVLGGIVVALAVIAGGVAIAGWLRGARSIVDDMMVPFVALAVVLYGFLFNWRFRRSYRNYKAIQEPVEMELSETQFHGQSIHGETRLPWEIFQKYKENKRCFLLYQTAGLFHILPKQLFESDSDIDRARGMLSQKVV